LTVGEVSSIWIRKLTKAATSEPFSICTLLKFEYLRSRDDKRYTEKKNKSERARRKKEDTARLRGIVDLCLGLDPRIKRIKQEEKDTREAKKKAKTGGPAQSQKALEEEAKKKAEEEAKKKEEDEATARAEAKKAKAAAANAAKKARRAQRDAAP
jgi:DnaJ family protein C protein 2